PANMTEIEFELPFAVTTSLRPSLLRSPTATAVRSFPQQLVPARIDSAAAKPGELQVASDGTGEALMNRSRPLITATRSLFISFPQDIGRSCPGSVAGRGSRTRSTLMA